MTAPDKESPQPRCASTNQIFQCTMLRGHAGMHRAIAKDGTTCAQWAAEESPSACPKCGSTAAPGRRWLNPYLCTDSFHIEAESPSAPQSDGIGRQIVKRLNVLPNFADPRESKIWDALVDAEARVQALEEALRQLVTKIKSMEGPINSCITMSWAHGAPYTGPNWTAELTQAESLLTPKPANEES